MIFVIPVPELICAVGLTCQEIHTTIKSSGTKSMMSDRRIDLYHRWMTLDTRIFACYMMAGNSVVDVYISVF